MSTYVIGDIQGCYDELMELLDKISFSVTEDKLIFVGDLVNRGPKSLEVLRFIKSLGKSAKVVLGNHDLYLLALSYGYLPANKNDTLDDILQAKDKHELVAWLKKQHLLYQHDNHIITHAGIPPNWSIKKAKKRARELEFVLQTDICCRLFLANLFGNEPNRWRKHLQGVNRWRCIANYFTRMRLCNDKGVLDLSFKGTLGNSPENFDAWFNIPNPKIKSKYTLIFGHWAALKGVTNNPRCIAIDTGCVWGGALSAYCIDSKHIYQVSSKLRSAQNG
ncbi:symmetrical bis(5'-nucleosyl)-tetraphosphatase [Fangia hongkongensis]|uniref:symmetrical bis(5'-nucleosyl)-tetraphosphatase n=1 Tax=Fangia hongkongensis TaxID=270495 RepID=UPI00037D80AE|nr:symmetrical bis(5'-nucleosyl)-tetraphosphatase [Fangia hongkongensis]MBK2124146.1 symmetrical bis(5'-nucleosyl)-tetraphosphatase [Fangia hongkongensis]